MPLNPRLRHWSGQVVWLLGASSGIGRATAHRLHGLGARVIVSARSEAALQAFVVEHAGSSASVVDVTDPVAVSRAAAAIAAASRNAGEGADTARLIRLGLKELAR